MAAEASLEMRRCTALVVCSVDVSTLVQKDIVAFLEDSKEKTYMQNERPAAAR